MSQAFILPKRLFSTFGMCRLFVAGLVDLIGGEFMGAYG